jgi:hypothetical protein
MSIEEIDKLIDSLDIPPEQKIAMKKECPVWKYLTFGLPQAIHDYCEAEKRL